MQTDNQDINNSGAQLSSALLEQQDMVAVELLASVNHTLRAPLTTIKISAQTLLRHEQQLSPQERREFLQTINQASDELAGAIEYLLEGAHVNTNTLLVEIIPFFIEGLCCPLR